MLDIAAKYEEKLQLLFANIAFDEKYKFYNGSSYTTKYKASESTWNEHQFVSLDFENNIIGYMRYSINREASRCTGLQIINFSNNQITFGKDVVKCIDDIFTKFNFRKLKYSVIVGNPIEDTYDKLTKRYGGRIIGVSFQDDLLMDGKLYDFKSYEIFRDDYIKNRRK